MITLPPLNDDQRLKLTELHRLTQETHAAVIRLESTQSGNHDTLKNIEAKTATIAQFFDQLDTVTKLAAGKNQVPLSLFVIVMILGAAYAISGNLKNTNMDIKIPWIGIEIISKEAGGK